MDGRPTTSRRQPNPTPDMFHDYVIQSPQGDQPGSSIGRRLSPEKGEVPQSSTSGAGLFTMLNMDNGDLEGDVAVMERSLDDIGGLGGIEDEEDYAYPDYPDMLHDDSFEAEGGDDFRFVDPRRDDKSGVLSMDPNLSITGVGLRTAGGGTPGPWRHFLPKHPTPSFRPVVGAGAHHAILLCPYEGRERRLRPH